MTKRFLACLALLSAKDQRKYKFILGIQLLLSLLDLVGVAVLGIVGTIAIKGIQSQQPGNRTSRILEILGIADISVQSQVALLGVGSMFVLVGRTIFSMIMTRKIMHFLSSKGVGISKDLLSRILANESVVLMNESPARLQYILGSGVSAISVGVLGTFATIVGDLGVLIVVSLGVLALNVEIALFSSILFGGVGLLLYFKLHLRAQTIGQNFASLNMEVDQLINEIVLGAREIYVKNRRTYYLNELSNLKDRFAFTYAENAYLPNIGKYVIEVTLIVGALLISALEFLRLDAAHAVAGVAIFVLAGTRIAPALLRLQQGFIAVKSHLGAAGPTLEVLERVHGLSKLIEISSPLSLEHEGFHAQIEIRDAIFAYDSNPIFKLSIDHLLISEGETIAIVGESGSGKSTLVDLLLGIIKPDSGEILINSMPPDRAISTWPGAIGYVPQTIFIRNGTVVDNVGFGYPHKEIETDQVKRALVESQLIDFVLTTPEQESHLVGDRGSRLSGGQRQRLGIARALYTNPKLLILDEATSALDGIVESEVSEAIRNLKSTSTVILIAHRLSTVKMADRVIYLENGQILASGTFEDLRLKVPNFDRLAKLSGL